MRLKLSFLQSLYTLSFFFFLIFTSTVSLSNPFSPFDLLKYFVTLPFSSLMFEFFNWSSFFSYNDNVLFLATRDLSESRVVFWNVISNVPKNFALFFSIKFLFCIAFLIFIRGGTPRYRYDYLTKIGWLKFLGFTLLVFFFNLFLYILI